jgi:hypothetical protein
MNWNVINIIFSIIILSNLSLRAQIPDANRRANWVLAGIQEPPPVYSHLYFTGDTSGTIDNAPALQAILDTITRPLIILFGKGNYLFNTALRMKSNTILKGLGNSQTHFIFNQNQVARGSIEIYGSQTGNYNLLADAQYQDRSIVVSNSNAALFSRGDYFRMVQQDADLIQPGWLETITGQVIRVDSVVGGRIHFTSPLRMGYATLKNARIRKVNAVKHSGVECLKISRLDYANSGSGSANIDMRFAANCRITGVESFKCNFAHVEIFYSTNIQIEENYFNDAHNWGSNGRGYGVMLHYSTGEVLVQNNIFRRLRHSMILQAGANGNVFAYNFSYESRKEIFSGFFTTGEDMVCHGNYPYLNLFEGNYGEFASIDNAHGRNGPFNTFFRNIATTGGFNITNNQSNQQNFTGNHRLTTIGSFSASDHHITNNNWQIAASLADTSLYLTKIPKFLQSTNNWLIGPPLFQTNIELPARTRALTSNFIPTACDMIIWEDGKWNKNFEPSSVTTDFRLIVQPGHKLFIQKNLNIKSVEIKPGAELEIATNARLTVKE